MPTPAFLYDQGPQGHVDETNWYAPTELSVQGWAACICPGHSISEVRVLLNGELCGSVNVSYDRPDIGDHFMGSATCAIRLDGPCTRAPVNRSLARRDIGHCGMQRRENI
jgi:hypothetical protein